MKRFGLSLALLGVLLAACTSTPSDPVDEEESYSSVTEQESSSEEMTEEISFEGTIMRSGGEASRLVLPDGASIELQSNSYDLDVYAGAEVIATGTLEEDEEANRILFVTDIYVLSESSVSEESMSDAMSSEEEEEVVSFVASVSPSSSRVSSSAKSSVPRSSVAPARSSVATSQGSLTLSPDMQERVDKMAKVRGEETWTQRYCSTHIGLSFPVRKDWWYTSFGTRTGLLWHVEVSSQEIIEPGQGPLAVNVVSGRLPDGREDGQVVTEGGMAIGYRNWTDNRHVVVIAPAQLQSAVSFIVRNIGTCDGGATSSS